MKMKAFNVFTLVILTIAWWLVASRMWGASLDGLIVLTIIGWLAASVVVLAAKRVSHTVWIYAGLIILAALVLPDTMIVAIAARLPQPLQDPMAFTYLLILPVALVVAALLLCSGLNLHKKWRNVGPAEDAGSQAQRKHTGRASMVVFALSGLVLAKTLQNFYWFMVWDTTGDSVGNLWLLALPIPAVLFSSFVLFIALPGRIRFAGLSYLLLIPILIAVSARAQRVDFRALTEERAEQVSQAIEAYYIREGSYPQDLQQLTSLYLLALPDPMIMYGKGWCYQGGKDYYRFGYLDRDHWSSPILFGRVYSAKGHSPLKADVCQSVIDAYRMQHPDWDQALRDYGRPTPTPDIRE
jgi:hypothetical protein